jgi:quinolinate synthase
VADLAEIKALLGDQLSELEWKVQAPIIAEINRLKKEKRAVILAHNYQSPIIFHGVGDIHGDSLLLAQEAQKTSADIIVMAGVHFMAETAKLLSPQKKVLIPDLKAGCSLASSITGADVRLLKERFPGIPVVTYVNSSAEVKAETDVCCTSANAVSVVESLGVKKVIFLPDEFLGKWVATQTDVELILWKGHCEVHEQFTREELRIFRAKYPGIHIIAHPECPPDVLEEADYVGSTSGMIKHLNALKPPRVVMVTECSMADNVRVNMPETEFIKPCTLCPHMQRITLEKILESLQKEQFEVTIPEDIAARARASVERMIKIPRGKFG